MLTIATTELSIVRDVVLKLDEIQCKADAPKISGKRVFEETLKHRAAGNAIDKQDCSSQFQTSVPVSLPKSMPRVRRWVM